MTQFHIASGARCCFHSQAAGTSLRVARRRRRRRRLGRRLGRRRGRRRDDGRDDGDRGSACGPTSSSSWPSSRAELRTRRRRGARTRRHSSDVRLHARDPSTPKPRPHSSHNGTIRFARQRSIERCAREVGPCVSPGTFLAARRARARGTNIYFPPT